MSGGNPLRSSWAPKLLIVLLVLIVGGAKIGLCLRDFALFLSLFVFCRFLCFCRLLSGFCCAVSILCRFLFGGYYRNCYKS